MVLLKLFFEFLKVGAFSFGGGMSTLPYIYELSAKTSWISGEEISRILSVSQVTPGPLACNIGTVVGIKQNGFWGALAANIGFVIPAICFMTISYKFISKIKNNKKAIEVINVVRAASIAVLITSSVTLFKSAFLNEGLSAFEVINFKSIALAVVVYLIGRLKKIPTLYLMLISVCIGGIIQI